MSNARMTLEQMTEKFPDQWLFIIDCEISENTELLSGLFLLIVNLVMIFMKYQEIMKEGQQFIIQVIYQKGCITYCNH